MSTTNPAGRRKWGLGIPILSIHVITDMKINIHIDINMNIDGAVRRQGRGKGHGLGMGGDDINNSH